MDYHQSHPSGGMETSSPLDLSLRKDVLSRNPPGFWTRVNGKGSKYLKEVTKRSTDAQKDSFQEAGLCKDQACLPLRKRKYPPSPKEESPPVKYTDGYPDWSQKYYDPPYMAVPVPSYYQELEMNNLSYSRMTSSSFQCIPSPTLDLDCPTLGSPAFLPSTLPLYASPSAMNPSLLRIGPPAYHTTLLPTDSELQADIRAATQPDEDGDTALHIAVVHGNILAAQRVIALLKHGRRDLDILNNLRQTPLHLAVITNQPDMVSLLLDHGSLPQIPDRNGQTCVHLACEYGSIDSLRVLLRERTNNLAATNYQGKTALHLAIGMGRRDIAACLLEHGADVNAVDVKSGQSPLFQAVENGSEELVTLLLQHGSKVNALTYAGNTALHVASGRGLEEITRLLLRSGADGSIKNCHNDTAMMVAKDRKIADIIRGKSCSPHNERFRGEMKRRSCTPPPGLASSENCTSSPT